jgi:hypothetical protein
VFQSNAYLYLVLTYVQVRILSIGEVLAIRFYFEFSSFPLLECLPTAKCL